MGSPRIVFISTNSPLMKCLRPALACNNNRSPMVILKARCISCSGSVMRERLKPSCHGVKRVRQRDGQLAQAGPPLGIRCVTCFSDTACGEKNLNERDGGDQMLFLYICSKCEFRRAFSEEGTECRRKKILCSQCQREANIEYRRTGGEISIITTCPKNVSRWRASFRPPKSS